MRRQLFLPSTALLAALVITACGSAPAGPGWTGAPAEPGGPDAGPVAAKVVEVYRSPTCACCHEWEAYMRAHGWTVRSHETSDMTRVKMEHGLPDATWSCHTAMIDRYVVEGHVPIAAIEDLLQSRPDIDGIALAGMPAGSPGMTGTKAGAFQVLAVDAGDISPFGAY